MSKNQTALIGHYCPKCFMVVAYSTSKEEVDCPCCRVRAVPNAGLKEPDSRVRPMWDEKL